MASYPSYYNLQPPVIVDLPAVISSRCQGMVRLARDLAVILLISAQITESPWPPAATTEPSSDHQEGVLQEGIVHLQLKVPHHVSITDSLHTKQRLQR